MLSIRMKNQNWEIMNVQLERDTEREKCSVWEEYE